MSCTVGSRRSLDEILSDFVKGIALALEPIRLRGLGRFDLETLRAESRTLESPLLAGRVGEPDAKSRWCVLAVRYAWGAMDTQNEPTATAGHG